MGNKHVEYNRCGTSSVLKKSVTYVRLAQLDRAFGYGPKGRGFESSNARWYVQHIFGRDGEEVFKTGVSSSFFLVSFHGVPLHAAGAVL